DEVGRDAVEAVAELVEAEAPVLAVRGRFLAHRRPHHRASLPVPVSCRPVRGRWSVAGGKRIGRGVYVSIPTPVGREPASAPSRVPRAACPPVCVSGSSTGGQAARGTPDTGTTSNRSDPGQRRRRTGPPRCRTRARRCR